MSPKHASAGTVLAAAAVLALAGCGGTERHLAVVNGTVIDVKDFRERYAAFLEQRGVRDNIVVRKDVLNNMVNEVLIHEDIRRLGLDRDEAAVQRLEAIRVQAILDGYARRVSTDTVTVSRPELMEEFRRMNTRVNARYLYARSEEAARDLKRRLAAGATFEELARDVFEDPGLAANGGSLGWFGWGEMEPALEEAAYTLPPGEVSDPVRLAVGYGIVRVDDRKRQPLVSEYDFLQAREKLERAVRKRKTLELVRREAYGAQAELSPRFVESSVQAVWRHWPVLARGGAPPADPETGADSVRDLSALPFAAFAGRSWTVRDFVRRLQATTERQRRRVTSVDALKETATGLAVREVLLDRARAAGLETDSRVQQQVQQASEAYLLRRWASHVQDTVGQHGWPKDTLYAQYAQNRELYAYPEEVNVAEVLLRTEEEAKEIRRLLDRGADFSSLARTRSIRLWAARRGGELGFGTRSTFGVLGDRFLQAAPGSLIGPEFVDPYWGVFKILERRGGRLKTLDEAAPQIAEDLTRMRKVQAFRGSVETLRANARIAVDIDMLANISLQ